MVRVSGKESGCKDFVERLGQALFEEMGRQFQTQLDAEVEQWLYRSSHQRRKQVKQQHSRAQCGCCGSRRASDFSRNGHRRRQMVTTLGVMTFWLPRVVCKCGGSVRIPFSIVKPYQRLWVDVIEQVERWAGWGVSLRRMQAEIGETMQTQVGLRKLNELVQTIPYLANTTLSSVPPVILLDAIWVTLLQPTGEGYQDTHQRQRTRKQRHKVAVLVALGVWPQSGHWEVLDWQIASGEDQHAWETFLLALEERGVYRERGVQLIVHDGGKGLIAALTLIYPHIPHQRCLFHKLRNLWHAIRIDDDTLDRHARHDAKMTIFQQVRAIYRASTASLATARRDAFCNDYQATQPDLVATLQRDWADTITFYRLLERFPSWLVTTLRTTSLLERVNRLLRRLFRAAGAFHSVSGLLAAVSRVLLPYRVT